MILDHKYLDMNDYAALLRETKDPESDEALAKQGKTNIKIGNIVYILRV